MGDDEQLRDPDGLPAGRAVALDDRVRLWRDASIVLGGAPWGIIRIAAAARPFIGRLKDAGTVGLVPSPGVEHAAADMLLPRGIVHPLPTHHHQPGSAVEVIVPAYQRPDLLDECLGALRVASPDLRIIVVDDASSAADVGAVARSWGTTLIRHPTNRGPAAARNTGLAATTAPIVAFVDADCAVTPGWLDPLVAHFDDPRVGAVAPRVRPDANSDGLIARYERTHSALDMGVRPELVAHGAPLGYLPSATLLVRRTALGHFGFDEELRLGEDVDLVWRLINEGWMVRYEPASVVTHEIRPRLSDWAQRHFDYGSSAAELDRRHPRRLTPARVSGANLAAGSLILGRWPSAALANITGLIIAALQTALLARRLRRSSVDPAVAPVVVGRRMVTETAAIGHLLRREWWPLGWLALASTPRSRLGRFAAAAMLIPIGHEWLTRRTATDLPRYVALRLLEDAAYGSGVISGALRSRQPRVLLPLIRLPRRGRNGSSNPPVS